MQRNSWASNALWVTILVAVLYCVFYILSYASFFSHDDNGFYPTIAKGTRLQLKEKPLVQRKKEDISIIVEVEKPVNTRGADNIKAFLADMKAAKLQPPERQSKTIR